MNKNNKVNEKNQKVDMMDLLMGLGSIDNVDKYGEAASEFTKGYENSLKEISKYKVNPDYEFQNISQQAGKSAESISSSKQNAKNIINDDSTRKIRTDDLGMVNHEKYDHLIIEENGEFVFANGSQMKFKFPGIKNKDGVKEFDFNDAKAFDTAAEGLKDKLIDKKTFEKYEGAELEVPSDLYESVIEKMDEEYQKNIEQVEKLKLKNNFDEANKYRERAEQIKDTKSRLKDSNVSTKEAYEARVNPKLATAKNVVKVSHKAGVKHAKAGAAIAGSISTAINIASIYKGDKDPEEAALSVMKDTMKGAGVSYGVSAGGTALKSVMVSSKSATVKTLSKSNMPAIIIYTGIETTKTVTKYAKGEINELELMEELGEKGTGMLAASFGAAVGTVILPGGGTVAGFAVGSALGGMVGYMSSSQIYQSTMQVLRDERLSEQKREIIKSMSQQALKEMEELQNELEDYYEKYFSDRKETFKNNLSLLNMAVEKDDLDKFTNALSNLAMSFGKTLQFENFEEFDEFMQDEDSVLEL